MKKTLVALVAGLIFGVGLTVSQMIDPAKVIAFLDIAGNWDPSLAFVMGGGVVAWAMAYLAALRMGKPILAEKFGIPTRQDLDPRLLGGSAMFGVGWGLAGYCPGPAVSSLAFGRWESMVFLAAMLAGMFVFRLFPNPATPHVGAGF